MPSSMSVLYDLSTKALAPLEARLVHSMEDNGLPVVDVDDAVDIIGDPSQARATLLQLEKKGWLDRVRRGRYILNSRFRTDGRPAVLTPAMRASGIVSDGYVGWLAAAAHHGLTSLEPTTLRVATTRQHRPTGVDGVRIDFIKVKPEKLFGFQVDKSAGIAVSTIARTVVDCVDRPKFAGGYAEIGVIVRAACDRADVSEIVDAAIRNASVSTIQRLGFYLGTMRPDRFDETSRSRLLAHIGKGSRARMGNDDYRDGDFGYQKRWQLQVNLSPSDLRIAHE